MYLNQFIFQMFRRYHLHILALRQQLHDEIIRYFYLEPDSELALIVNQCFLRFVQGKRIVVFPAFGRKR